MKIESLIIQCIIFIVLLSCGKTEDLEPMDNNSPNDQFELIINRRGLGANSVGHFIVVTSQNGEPLYEFSGLEYVDTIRFNYPIANKVDLTVGNEQGKWISLETYRGVASKFKLPFMNCSPIPVPIPPANDSLYRKSIELNIKGLSGANDVIAPIFSKEILNNENSNETVVKGFLPSSEELHLTIISKENAPFSIILKPEDWENGLNTDLTRTIDISEFYTPKVHEIILDKTGEWLVNAVLVLENNRKLIVSLDGNYFREAQEGEILKLYSPMEVSISEVELSIRGINRLKDHHYRKKSISIPRSISFFAPTIDIKEVNSKRFDIDIQQSYDLVKIEYDYLNDNALSPWRIYQSSSSNLSFELPEIPQEYLEKTTYIKEGLANPHSFSVRVYRIDEDNYETKYLQGGQEINVDCLDNISKLEGFEF